MGLINIPDIQNLDAATPELFNSRFGAIADLLNGNLDTNNFASEAITAPDIATGAVTTGKLASAAVTPVKWTNPYKFYIYRSGALNSSNSYTLVQFDAEAYDSNNNADITTNKGRYTAPVAGFYFFTANVGNSAAGSTPIYVALYKNGARVLLGSGSSAATSGAHSQVSGILQLAAGDYVEAYFIGGAGSAIDVGSDNCYFMGFLVTET